MKIGRGTVFRVICVLSLLVAVAIAMMWIKSMRGEAHLLSFVKAGERFTLRSKSGQLMLTGPPQGGMEEPRIAELASQMSNGDFAWSAGASPAPHFLARIWRVNCWVCCARVLEAARRDG